MSAPKHTAGPWRWEFNRKHKQMHLVGGVPTYDLTIMEPVRWGMHGNGLMFRDTAYDGFNIMHKLHEREDWVKPFPGRDHHAKWCANVIHPDAVLIAAAPELLEALTMVRDADNDSQRDGLPTIPSIARNKIDAAINKATGDKS